MSCFRPGRSCALKDGRKGQILIKRKNRARIAFTGGAVEWHPLAELEQYEPPALDIGAVMDAPGWLGPPRARR